MVNSGERISKSKPVPEGKPVAWLKSDAEALCRAGKLTHALMLLFAIFKD